MAGLQVVINVSDSTLPDTQRQVLLDGLAADLATQLASYYNGISVVVEDSYAKDEDCVITHEITGSVYSPYFAVYGGGTVYAP